jgi:hypothetical protein
MNVAGEVTPMDLRPHPAQIPAPTNPAPCLQADLEVRRLLRRLGRHASLLRTVAAAPRPAPIRRPTAA